MGQGRQAAADRTAARVPLHRRPLVHRRRTRDRARATRQRDGDAVLLPDRGRRSRDVRDPEPALRARCAAGVLHHRPDDPHAQPARVPAARLRNLEPAGRRSRRDVREVRARVPRHRRRIDLHERPPHQRLAWRERDRLPGRLLRRCRSRVLLRPAEGHRSRELPVRARRGRLPAMHRPDRPDRIRRTTDGAGDAPVRRLAQLLHDAPRPAGLLVASAAAAGSRLDGAVPGRDADRLRSRDLRRARDAVRFRFDRLAVRRRARHSLGVPDLCGDADRADPLLRPADRCAARTRPALFHRWRHGVLRVHACPASAAARRRSGRVPRAVGRLGARCDAGVSPRCRQERHRPRSAAGRRQLCVGRRAPVLRRQAAAGRRAGQRVPGAAPDVPARRRQAVLRPPAGIDEARAPADARIPRRRFRARQQARVYRRLREPRRDRRRRSGHVPRRRAGDRGGQRPSLRRAHLARRHCAARLTHAAKRNRAGRCRALPDRSSFPSAAARRPRHGDHAAACTAGRFVDVTSPRSPSS
ncbi:hypothetical protein Bcep18194_B2688 [Burkholderia lata]|uniref:Uncharacterized protein n=1 Tax=Burkholderia lata (strain ATCC 17760 / DSM 23089 / LMG 22485 / NCIMB 9086 / R18194 / 383) TaxID=482957 RepID=Q391R7_BURL3|nr:hypothetical protein Bcep18194_B2688 [Burkholderia lata]